jgi:predicted transcriptional regulator of viral defense system
MGKGKMSFEELRKRVQGEIFDYQMLIHYLKEYKKPRDKISLLLKNESIIRIRKGIYIFGPQYQKRAISLEILASLIYSPSYISLEYALSKYGLIPERVVTVTSICLSRSKTFQTPLAPFSYSKRSSSVYPLGLTSLEIPQEGGYLMATPEKALVDFISQVKGISTVNEMQEHLYENLRMEPADLKKLNKILLSQILKAYQMENTLILAIYD